MAKSDQDEPPSNDRRGLPERLGAATTSSNGSDEPLDPAIEAIGKRFRSTSSRQSTESESTLDGQRDPARTDASPEALEDDVLDALDADPEPRSSQRIRDTNTGVGEPNADLGQMPGPRGTGDRDTDAEAGGPAADGSHSVPSPDEIDGSEQVCPDCGADCPDGVRFCVQCGTALTDDAASQAERSVPSIDESRLDDEIPSGIELVTIADDGTDGTAIPIRSAKTILGRDGDARFPTDEFLNPHHARLTVEDDTLYLQDLDSLNGTYLKLEGETDIDTGDTFLMGQQVLRFESIREDLDSEKSADDGTRYMGSPAPGGDYKILQVGVGEIIQNVYCLPEDGVVLGREKGDILFPRDKFMSGRHARVDIDGDQPMLADLDSSNGTWLKTWERVPLSQDDYIFMGQQLFRVEVPG